MTKARVAVLDAVNEAGKPLSAADVFDVLKVQCDQATVYRALHYLESTGYVESFVLHAQDQGVKQYYVSNQAVHSHWFYCEACNVFLDLGSCKIGDLITDFEQNLGLRVSRHIFYMTGLCPQCLVKE